MNCYFKEIMKNELTKNIHTKLTGLTEFISTCFSSNKLTTLADWLLLAALNRLLPNMISINCENSANKRKKVNFSDMHGRRAN